MSSVLRSRLCLVPLLLAGCASPWSMQEPAPPPPGAARTHPDFTVIGSYGTGELEHDTSGSALSDIADADFWRIRADKSLGGNTFGFGLSIERYASTESVFPSAPDPADISDVDVGLYTYTAVGDGARFRMPMRFGVFFNQLDLDFRITDVESDWFTLGSRLSLEPELVLLSSEKLEWSLFGEASGAIGTSFIDVTAMGSYFFSSALHYGLEIGTRVQLGPAVVGVSWVKRWLNVLESEINLGIYIREIEDGYEGFLLSAGLRF